MSWLVLRPFLPWVRKRLAQVWRRPFRLQRIGRALWSGHELEILRQVK